MFTVIVTGVVPLKQKYKAVRVEDTSYLENNKEIFSKGLAALDIILMKFIFKFYSKIIKSAKPDHYNLQKSLMF